MARSGIGQNGSAQQGWPDTIRQVDHAQQGGGSSGVLHARPAPTMHASASTPTHVKPVDLGGLKMSVNLQQHSTLFEIDTMRAPEWLDTIQSLHSYAEQFVLGGMQSASPYASGLLTWHWN